MGMKNNTEKHFYDDASKNIIAKIKLLGMNNEDTEKAIDLAMLLRAAFKLKNVKKKTFKTKDSPEYELGYDSGGFCRIASTVFMAAMGAADWELMVIDDNQWGHGSHHFLKHRPTGKFFDLTYDQFAVKGLDVPYNLGRPANDQCATIGTDGLKFAQAAGIDIIALLKENSRKGK